MAYQETQTDKVWRRVQEAFYEVKRIRREQLVREWAELLEEKNRPCNCGDVDGPMAPHTPCG